MKSIENNLIVEEKEKVSKLGEKFVTRLAVVDLIIICTKVLLQTTLNNEILTISLSAIIIVLSLVIAVISKRLSMNSKVIIYLAIAVIHVASILIEIIK